jgi:type IV pilus assembly protein PilN
MIRINLLPFRSTRKSENIRRQLSVFLLSLVLTVVGLFAVNLFLDNQVEDLKKSIASTQGELEKYDKINKEIGEIKRKLDSLNKKMAVIRELEISRYEPTRLMDTITQVLIQKRMWLTSLKYSTRDVNLAGLALDDKTIADFMIRLEGCGLYSSVDLKGLKQVEIQKTQLKSFEVSCVRKPILPPEAKGPVAAGAKN